VIAGGDYEAITEAFWTLCRQASSHVEREVQESYLLARPLSHARNRGSRRIVADACLVPRTEATPEELATRTGNWIDSCGMAARRPQLLPASPVAPPT
jgi:hypothetical protein